MLCCVFRSVDEASKIKWPSSHTHTHTHVHTFKHTHTHTQKCADWFALTLVTQTCPPRMTLTQWHTLISRSQHCHKQAHTHTHTHTQSRLKIFTVEKLVSLFPTIHTQSHRHTHTHTPADSSMPAELGIGGGGGGLGFAFNSLVPKRYFCISI